MYGLKFLDPIPSESALTEFYRGYNDLSSVNQILEHNTLWNINPIGLFEQKYVDWVLCFTPVKDVFLDS